MAAVTAAAVVVLSLGLIRVHPLLAVGLNLVAVGGLAPTVWGWRKLPVWRWFVLGPASASRARGWPGGAGSRTAEPMSASASLACHACSSSAPRMPQHHLIGTGGAVLRDARCDRIERAPRCDAVKQPVTHIVDVGLRKALPQQVPAVTAHFREEVQRCGGRLSRGFAVGCRHDHQQHRQRLVRAERGARIGHIRRCHQKRIRAVGPVPRQRQHVGAERGQHPRAGIEARGVQRVEVRVERLQRPRPVRAAKADGEAARVIALQGLIRRDDVRGGYRINGDDAGGHRNARGGPHRRVEHRQVAGPPQRGEAQALNALGFVGDNRRIVGVRIAAGEADRSQSGHEVDARTSTGLQVKATQR